MARMHESFTYFQVDRPVIEGGDAFVRRLRELSGVLGSVTTTALTQTVLQKEPQPAPKITTRPLDESLLDVFRQNELRLVLFRRVAQTSNMKSFLLSAMESRAEHDPEFMDVISRDNETCRGARETLVCDEVDYADDLAYGRTLVLRPDHASSSVVGVGQLAGYCRDTFDIEAPQLGRDSIFASGVIPVASLADSVEDIEANRFLEIVNQQILPIKVAVGGVQAYRSFTLSNGLML